MSRIAEAMMPEFDGQTYESVRDNRRMTAQHERVFKLMTDGLFRTLFEIEDNTGDPCASISARLRDFRKDKFGGHTVNRRHLGTGLWAYQLIVNQKAPAHLRPMPDREAA